MRTPSDNLNPAQLERLALLLEELGEAQQAIGKVLRHGYESRWPKPGGPTNRETLAKELGDVLCAIDILCASDGGDLDFVDLNIRRHEKRARIQQFLHYVTVHV